MLSNNDNAVSGHRFAFLERRGSRFLLFARLARISSICPSVRPNRIQKCRFRGKIRFAQPYWQWFMDGDEKHEAWWIVPRKERHTDLSSSEETWGRKCPLTIIPSFFTIVTRMLNDDKTLDVTFTFCYQVYTGCYTILSVISLWIRN